MVSQSSQLTIYFQVVTASLFSLVKKSVEVVHTTTVHVLLVHTTCPAFCWILKWVAADVHWSATVEVLQLRIKFWVGAHPCLPTTPHKAISTSGFSFS